MDSPRRARADGLLGADLLARLDRWVAELRADDAAARRARERWLLTQAEESSTFAGVLVDLAEHGTPVVVDGPGGRRHRGTIAAVARDFCALRTAAGREVLLAYAGIAAVRARSGTAATGDRALALTATLDEALATLAEERPRVLVVTHAGGEGIAGELRTVGRDVVTVRVDGRPPAPVFVAIAAIAEISLVG